jgi:hypothetical protein
MGEWKEELNASDSSTILVGRRTTAQGDGLQLRFVLQLLKKKEAAPKRSSRTNSVSGIIAVYYID